MPDELFWFWQAFWELDTCRDYRDGVPAHIPWTAALTYAKHHEIEFDYLWHLIVTLDNAFVDFYSKKRKAEIDELDRKSKSRGQSKKGVRNGRR